MMRIALAFALALSWGGLAFAQTRAPKSHVPVRDCFGACFARRAAASVAAAGGRSSG